VRKQAWGVVAVIGSALALAACGSASSTPSPASSATRAGSGAALASAAAVSPAAAVPAGYQRVGGSAQGISVAAPASWIQVNLATQSIQAAANSLNVHGISASSLIQDMESLQKLHAVYVVDVGAVASSPHHFAPNLNAYCGDSGITEVGSAGVAYIKSLMAGEFEKIATNVTQQDIVIGGVPGVETSYDLSSSAEGTIPAMQLEVLPKPDQACFVTLTTLGSSQSAASILRVAAATAQFP
jgi:hypothetical protein